MNLQEQALAVAQISLAGQGYELATIHDERVTYGLAIPEDEADGTQLLLLKARQHVRDGLSTKILDADLQRTQRLADRLGAKPGLALLAHATEMQSIFVLARVDSLTEAADDPAAKWITRKSGEVGLQLNYSRLQRAGLLADPRIAGFEFDFKLKTNPFVA